MNNLGTKIIQSLLIATSILIVLLLESCAKPFVKNAPKDTFYVYKNNIELIDSHLKKSEKTDLLQKLYVQIDDHAKVKTSKYLFFIKVIKHPSVFDSALVNNSIENMNASLFHSGYYHAEVSAKTDTIKKKISVHYVVTPNSPTLIDTLNYRFKTKELQDLGKAIKKTTYLLKGTPITKIGILTEVNRIVDSFRNNGYYKFTAAELKVLGDTSIEALTLLSDDPFEQFRVITAAQQMREHPRIKVTISIPSTTDSSRLKKYFINNIIVYPDLTIDNNDNQLESIKTEYFTIKQHKKIFNFRLHEKLISFRVGHPYTQLDYNKTLYNLSKTGAWQSINIQTEEVKGSDSLLDVIIQLVPSNKYGFETALEMSYSASNVTNVLAGNLFGISGNISLTNRNLAKESVRMIHNLRAGIELNNNSGGNNNIINSNELSYTNTTSFPRLLFPFIPNALKNKRNYSSGETYIGFGTNYITRLNLFKLQSTNLSFGWTGLNNKTWKWNWTFLNFGYSNLFNKTDSFEAILKKNPFINSSYNTAFVNGMGVSFYKAISNFNHPHSQSKEFAIKYNFEESGLSWGLLPIFNNNKRRFVKGDAEIKYNVKYNKTAFACKGFLGIGVPLLGIDKNKTLPLFKQYFAGGSNSMRAWPVRGIGPGGNALIPYSSDGTNFNDRTGDIQLELNSEFRYDIARIIPNTLTLRGAVFTDIGNVWNTRNSKSDGSTDTSQFQFKNFYKQTGISAGTGFRLDFNYFIVRFDLGFRIKRPEIFYQNDGWKLPNINLDDCLKKIFTRGTDDEYRRWRYENFNFTIGIGYPF